MRKDATSVQVKEVPMPSSYRPYAATNLTSPAPKFKTPPSITRTRRCSTHTPVSSLSPSFRHGIDTSISATPDPLRHIEFDLSNAAEHAPQRVS